MKLKIATIVGARPQFIKAKPLSSAIAVHNKGAEEGRRLIDQVLVHTGQHYDYGMSRIFFEDLDLPAPDYDLAVGSGNHGWQTAEMLKKIEDVLLIESPHVVVVFGDTNSTLAGALAAAKLHVPIAHVEAGLRSFNRRMPEEINRVLTDHLSEYLFVPNQSAADNLNSEGIHHGIFQVGDVMYEAAMEFAKRAEVKSTVLQQLRLKPGEYSLATVHRAENTDNEERLENIFAALSEISKELPVVWPLHPRTRGRFTSLQHEHARNGNGSNGLLFVDPVSYLDMLQLEMSARVVLTDSGGVQKEAFWFQVPCVTLRNETEWPETMREGRNQLTGSGKKAILDAFAIACRLGASNRSDDGAQPQVAAKIVATLTDLV